LRRCGRGTREREGEMRDPVLDRRFLEEVDTPKRCWHEPSAQQKGILPAYRWTGPGRDGLKVVHGDAESRPNAATVSEVWRQRHGHAPTAGHGGSSLRHLYSAYDAPDARRARKDGREGADSDRPGGRAVSVRGVGGFPTEGCLSGVKGV
jgi:hypothetical protein